MPTEIVTTREIGVIIRNRRKELGLSQEQLSEKVGVSYQQIQRYENGGSMLNVENVQRVARALSIPVTLFFEDTKKPVAVNDSIVISSTDEKTLLKHFKQIESNPDRLAVIQVARRLAVKGIT
ncbi:MAG: helix-turn-helix transcriptional regulator [Desulfuromonadaceae bacterium]|nr:helix-turn-helix transcriptional regulator [Desulfuromonadaceae bacterium]MDD2856604.1 helix-turn-helix transcriptional regulator [Desulfuromonadaceae bacterium]